MTKFRFQLAIEDGTWIVRTHGGKPSAGPMLTVYLGKLLF